VSDELVQIVVIYSGPRGAIYTLARQLARTRLYEPDEHGCEVIEIGLQGQDDFDPQRMAAGIGYPEDGN